MGLKGFDRTPRDDVRARRNAAKLHSEFDTLLGDGLEVSGEGLITLALATNPGLEFTSGALRAKVSAPIIRDASGIGLSFGTGLQNDSGTLKSKDSEIDHDSLLNFVANEHIDWTNATATLLTTGDIHTTAGGLRTNHALIKDRTSSQLQLRDDTDSSYQSLRCLGLELSSIQSLTTAFDIRSFTASSARFRFQTYPAGSHVTVCEFSGGSGTPFIGMYYNPIVDGCDLTFANAGRIGWTKKTAASVSAGTVGDLQTLGDGNFHHTDEAAATPGFSLTVGFTSIAAFNWVQIVGTYAGTHSVGIQLYNWTTATWDTFGAMDAGVADVSTAGEYILGNHSFFVPDDANYIGTGGDAGKVNVRFHHTAAGNASHDLDLDVVALYQ